MKRGDFAMIGGKGDMQVLNETGMAAFEESIRKALEERRKVIGMTEQALGSLAFPHVADSRRKVQSIRKGQGSGENRKPQQIRMTDVMNLLAALGLPWEKVIKQAFADAETAQKEEQEKIKALLATHK